MDSNNNKAGCGLIFIDLLAMTVFIGLMLHKGAGLHIVFSLLIGAAATAFFVFLARIPYVGRLFQAALGLIWGLIVYFALYNIFHYSKDVGLMKGLRENDLILWWAIVIVVDVFFVLLHIGSFSLCFGTMNLHRKSRRSYSQQQYENNEGENSNRIYVEEIDGVPVNTYIDLDDDNDDNINT